MPKHKISQDKKIEFFEKEFLPHIDALKTFAYYLTYDEEETNDLVQETYLKAFKFADKYVKGTNSKAWLFKILKNAYINEYRKKNRQPDRIDFEEVKNYHIIDEPEENIYFELKEEFFDSIMGDEVTQAIKGLPEEFRTIILLADIDEFSYKEMALILNVPLGTVRSRLFRARNMLKELLKNYATSLGYEDFRGSKSQDE